MSLGATSSKCFDASIAASGNDAFTTLSTASDIARTVSVFAFDAKLRLASGSGSFVVSSLAVMLTMFFSDVLNDSRGALINKNASTATSKW